MLLTSTNFLLRNRQNIKLIEKILILFEGEKQFVTVLLQLFYLYLLIKIRLN